VSLIADTPQTSPPERHYTRGSLLLEWPERVVIKVTSLEFVERLRDRFRAQAKTANSEYVKGDIQVLFSCQARGAQWRSGPHVPTEHLPYSLDIACHTSDGGRAHGSCMDDSGLARTAPLMRVIEWVSPCGTRSTMPTVLRPPICGSGAVSRPQAKRLAQKLLGAAHLGAGHD
jgi:hypothetical protein